MTDRQDCPFRHKNGNCLRIGGFCLAVSDEMCTAIQGAYARGVADAISFVNSAKEIEKVNGIKQEGSDLGMTDREKVIFGLKCLTNEDPYMSRISCKKKKCPYAETETDNCAPAIWRDALELLKGQEPVEPRKILPCITRPVGGYVCGHCGIRFLEKNDYYCSNCGRAVKWDE